MLHLLDHARKQGFGGARPEHDQKLVLDVRNEAEDRETGEKGDQSEHQQDKQDAGRIERGDECAEVDQRAQSIGTDRESHRSERSEGGGAHNDSDQAEEHLSRDGDPGRDLLAD